MKLCNCLNFNVQFVFNILIFTFTVMVYMYIKMKSEINAMMKPGTFTVGRPPYVLSPLHLMYSFILHDLYKINTMLQG